MRYLTLYQIFTFLFAISICNGQKIIEVPMHLVDGFGPFVPFADIVKRQNPESRYAKLELQLEGVPENWEKVFVENIQFDPNQFHYQNYKKGLIDQEWFNGMNIDLSSRQYTDKYIRCFAYMVLGKNKAGKWVYKVDTDQDLNFQNNEEREVPILKNQKDQNEIKRHQFWVEHEAIIDGQVEQIESPVLLRYIPERRMIIRNFPQYAVAHFEGRDIYISSDDFTTTSYDHVRVIISGEKPSNPQGDEDILIINNQKYKLISVVIDQRKLILQKLEDDKNIYSSQIGYPAFPIAGKEFTTGTRINLDDFKGKFVFVEFWGSWCGPCMEAIPTLRSVYNSIDTTKIEFLGIAQDQPSNIRRVLEKEGINWKQIQVEEDDPILKNYKLDQEGFPFSLLIDPEGKILKRRIPTNKLLEELEAID